MEKKLHGARSLKLQLVVIVLIITLVTGLLMIFIYSPSAKKEISALSQDYINDLAVAYGGTLDMEIEEAGGDATQALSADALAQKLAGVGMQGVDSSYVYVVDAEGTMLYHPTAEKIGVSVENEVVKQAIADMQAGKTVENGVISYEFKGDVKYAALYVSTYKQFMLIVSANEDEVLQPITNINKRSILGLVIVVVICTLIGLFFATLIVNPIKQMTSMTERFANMDFTDDGTEAKVFSRRDEIGNMSRVLISLRTELTRMVEQIRQQSALLYRTSEGLNVSASETTNTVEQLETAVNEIAQGATTQASDTQLATEKVVSMGNMVEDTDNKVVELVQYAQQMQKSGSDATEILNQLEQVNTQAEEYIQVIAEQTMTTNDSAQKIHEAASMITEIAEETNLLSLNASIEAARAGEQGRGFAVVASQIQKLAEQSNESAKQIGEIIQTLMQDSQKAVAIMEDVKEIMNKQSEHVERTKDAFTEIQTGIEQSISGMGQISEKTQQMDKARSGVIDIVQNLSAIAEQNAASTEETSASMTEVSAISGELSEAARQLREISQSMEESMAVFKI